MITLGYPRGYRGVNVDKPKLPKGWHYIEAPSRWLMAWNEIDGGDRLWYVFEDRLCPRKKDGIGVDLRINIML